MLYYKILYYIILYYNILYYNILYYIILYYFTCHGYSNAIYAYIYNQLRFTHRTWIEALFLFGDSNDDVCSVMVIENDRNGEILEI